jgi:hypothetical protein
MEKNKDKPLPLIADSGNGKDQKLGFFFTPKTWDTHLKSEDQSLKSLEDLENDYENLNEFDKRIRMNKEQLLRHFDSKKRGDEGWKAAAKALANEADKGNPPIEVLSNNSQLAMKFL